jgi:hypothetical protein
MFLELRALNTPSRIALDGNSGTLSRRTPQDDFSDPRNGWGEDQSISSDAASGKRIPQFVHFNREHE